MAAGSGYLIGLEDGGHQVEALDDWRPPRNVVGTMAGQDAPMDRTDGRRR